MIQITCALILILWKSELSEHWFLFSLIVATGIVDMVLKNLIRNGTAFWPDGSVDHARSAPIIRTVAPFGGLLMFVRPILLIILAIMVFI